MAKVKVAKDQIPLLMDSSAPITDFEAIEKCIVDLYKRLYSSDLPSRHASLLTKYGPGWVTVDDNAMLLQIPSNEEMRYLSLILLVLLVLMALMVSFFITASLLLENICVN